MNKPSLIFIGMENDDVAYGTTVFAIKWFIGFFRREKGNCIMYFIYFQLNQLNLELWILLLIIYYYGSSKRKDSMELANNANLR
jgi:hypothetical protein